MSVLAVAFILLFDLVLIAGFRVFHTQMRDRFYYRCVFAYSFEALSTLTLFLLAQEEWQYLAYTFLFNFQCIKGLMLWSAIRSLDDPTSHKWWVPIVFIGYCLVLVAITILDLGKFTISQIAITFPLIFNLAPAWALYRSRWIFWKSYQLFLGCILFSQILFAAAVQMGGVDTNWSMLLYYLFMVSNVFVGLSGMVIGMKRLHARLETALKTITSMRNQTEAIVKASMDSILITNLEGTILFANPVAKSFFIHDEDDHPNLFEHEFFPESQETTPFTLERIKHELVTETNAFIKWQCVMGHEKQGDIPVEITVVPIRNDEDSLLAFYIRDLREQRENEAAIILERDRTEKLNMQLSAALERAQSMTEKAEQANAAKNDFLGVMSHELRTPLSAIIGMSTMIEQEPLTAQQRQSVASITDCGQSLLMIIGDILNYSRIEAGRIELENKPFQLRHCTEQVLALMRNQCNHKGLRLLGSLHPRLPQKIVGDEGKIRQVLTNLVSNAVKFTDSGHVSVDFREVISVKSHLPQLEIIVKDTGIGINQEQKERLFEAFYQADYSASRRYQGTGLGLAICKRLIESMGGEIRVESVVGKGATFTVRIPYMRVESDVSTQYSFEGSVIIVDPDESGLDWMERNLSAHGIKAKGYASIETLLKRESINRLNRTVCLIDQDAFINVSEKPQILEQLKNFQENVPLVFACHQILEILQEFEHSLTKPFLIEQFIELVESIPSETQKIQQVSSETPRTFTPFKPLQIKVLVAEDHPINCKLAKLYLDKLGCESHIVHDGHEALAAYEEEEYDVVLMDLHMPSLDGFETARQLIKLQEGKGRPRIIALTAGASSNEKQNALDAGMDDFLLKPVQIEDLHAALVKQIKASHD
jgi:signal transduction histidine kinase/CheY-like chemotaxis protein